MDLEDFNPFEKASPGIFALITGMVLILTTTYFIYQILPDSGEPFFQYALIVIVLGAVISPLFFLENFFESFLGSDVVGKFLAGIMVALIAWVFYHNWSIEGLSGGKISVYLLVPAILAFLTTLLLVRGVIIPILDEAELWGEEEWDSEDSIKHEDEEKHPLEEEEEEEDFFPEEIDESW